LTENNRKYPRFDVKWPVIVKNGSRVFKGEILVISANGGFIRSGESLEPNRIIHLTINVSESTPLELDATVVSSAHSHPEDEKYPYSIGVHFEKGNHPA
jgi:transcriptional regulator of NAD metabolism